MKCAKSSKTGPCKVSRLYDLISGGKRPLKGSHFQNAEFQTAVYPPKIGRTAVKLGGNPFRTILHISFFFFGGGAETNPRPAVIADFQKCRRTPPNKNFWDLSCAGQSSCVTACPLYRFIFKLVPSNFSLVASPSSRRRPSASVRFRPRIREAAVLTLGGRVRGGRRPPPGRQSARLRRRRRCAGAGAAAVAGDDVPAVSMSCRQLA